MGEFMAACPRLTRPLVTSIGLEEEGAVTTPESPRSPSCRGASTPSPKHLGV